MESSAIISDQIGDLVACTAVKRKHEPYEETTQGLLALPLEMIRRVHDFLAAPRDERIFRTACKYLYRNLPAMNRSVTILRLSGARIDVKRPDYPFHPLHKPVDNVIRCLQTYPNLQEFSIRRSLTDVEGMAVARGPNPCNVRPLKKLLLPFHSMSDTEMLTLAENSRLLEHLEIDGSRISDRGLLPFLDATPWLECLKLGWNEEISNRAILALCKCPQLKVLTLNGNPNITAANIQILAHNRSRLKEIDLSLSPNLTDAVLIPIALNCPQLEKLSLKKVPITADAALLIALNCPQLRSLKLENGSNALIQELDGGQLEELELEHNDPLTDETLIGLARRSPNLRSLSLGNTNQISAAFIRELGFRCPKLEYLVLRKNQEMKEGAALLELQSRCPNLWEIDLGDNEHISDEVAAKLEESNIIILSAHHTLEIVPA